MRTPICAPWWPCSSPSGDDWTAAGWLHDALEDTQLTYGALSNQLGKRVADLVWAVTGEGSDRKERNGSIYRKIMQNPEAATLKLADRIANVEASHGTRHMRKYADEIDEFRAAILDHVPREMWMRLERAFLPPV